MSDKYTHIKLGKNSSLGHRGHASREEMIAEYRDFAEREKRQADAILAAKDEDFIVVQCYGNNVRHKSKVLPPEGAAK